MPDGNRTAAVTVRANLLRSWVSSGLHLRVATHAGGRYTERPGKLREQAALAPADRLGRAEEQPKGTSG